jgi:hypothetical protein
MRATRLINLLLLLGFCGSALAQSTSLQSFSGFRDEGSGRVSDSNATFALGVTRDNGATYINSAGVSDSVQILGEVRPDPAHIGQTADIYVVDRLLDTNEFRMRTQDNVWVPWNVMIATLVPFRTNVPLNGPVLVDMFTGTLGTAGNHRLFIGYKPADGVLRYHVYGLPLTISAQSQSAREQALSLFTSTISPNIVAVTCIACHVNGGSAPSVGAYTLRSPPESNLQANFDIYRGLVQSRGANFILSKASGGNEHSGGMQLSSSSAEYQSFSNFLNLLAQDLAQ